MSKPVQITLSATGTTFDSTMKSAKKSLDDAKNSANGLRGALDKVKDAAGRGSTLDEFGKALRGGGALLGLTLMGEVIDNVAKKALEINKEFRAGQLDAAGMAVKIGEALPVIGKFVEAGQSIREIFTHEQEQIDNINADIKAGNAAMEARVSTQKIVLAAEKEIHEQIRKATEQLALAKASSPYEVELVERTNKSNDQKADRQKDLDEYTAKINEAKNKELEAIRAAGEARKKVLEDDANNKLSFYNKHSYNSGADEARQDAKNAADAQNQSAINSSLYAAQKRAKDAIEQHKKELDEKGKLDDQAIQAELDKKHNASTVAVKEAGELQKLIGSDRGIDLKLHGLTDEDLKHVKELQDLHLDSSKYIEAAEATNKLAEANKKAAEKAEDLKKTMEELGDSAKLRDFTQQFGKSYEKLGVDPDQIKDIFKLAHDGGSDQQIQSLVNSLVQANKDRGTKDLDDLRQHMERLRAAAAQGIDPRYAEDIHKLHLDPIQAQEFIRLSEAMKKLDEASKVKDHIKELKEEIAGIKGGVSAQDIELLNNPDVSDADKKSIAALENQKKLLEEAKQTFEETRTPAERYAETIKKLGDELKAGAIDQDTYDRAMKAAKKRESEEDKKLEPKEEARVITGERRFNFDIQGTGNNQLLQNAQQQLQIAKTTLPWFQQIWQKIVNGGATFVSLDSLGT